jgi:signal transduction histidine kinase
VAVQPLLDDVLLLVRPAAERKGVQLEPAAAPALETEADADKLKQILINLVDNAVKYSPPASRVRVRCQAQREGMRIAVEDEGPGIAADEVPHVFERFYRGRGAGATAGSGLGLAIARNLARLHGGDITLQSQPGRGSVFTLSLPTADARP